MAALGLALFTISSLATGHPVPPGPTAGFHDVFALYRARQAGPLAAQSAAPSAASPK
jgi:hypothetical protein